MISQDRILSKKTNGLGQVTGLPLAAIFIIGLFCGTMAVTLPALAGSSLPQGFIRADTLIPNLVLEMRYNGNNNFIGEKIDGYTADVCILHQNAANALAQVQAELSPFGLGIKVFDAYRPQMAVDHFVRWAKDTADTRMKAQYYPDVDKRDLFTEGYIASKSGHSRGSTVDLTLISLDTSPNPAGHPAELPMGSEFDFFGKVSWPLSKRVTPQERANRMLLRTLMIKNGFKPYDQEWWHFTLANEPFPDTYFNFPVQ